MLRSISKFKEYVKAKYGKWMRAGIVITDEERKATKGLFNAVVSESDSACSSVNAPPSDIMFLLMLIHLGSELNIAKEKLEKSQCAR